MSTTPIYNMTDTWNDVATSFTAVKMDVTDTASADGSLLLDLAVGGSSKFTVDKDGFISDALFGVADNSDRTKRVRLQLSGITTGNTRTYAVPDYDATLATLAGTETLTNKTLTSPTINGGTISGITDLAVADGGTGASNSETAKTNLRVTVDNIAALTALTKASLTNGEFALVKGYSSAGDLGGGYFRYDSSSSATEVTGIIEATDEGGTGRWLRLMPDGIVYPEFCGAAGDNSTDDETAFNVARDYARDNGKILCGLPGSTYYMASTSPSAITTVGTYRWKNLKLRSNITTSTRFLYFKGANPTNTLTLSANVAIGDTSVTVASGGGAYSAGDLVLIIETATEYHGSSDSTAYGNKSFFARVASATATTITLEEAIPRSFTAANSPTISICPETMIIDWENVEIFTSSAPTGSVGVRFENAVVKCKGCHVHDFDDTCFEASICYEPEFINCKAEDADFANTGYGFNIGGCYNASLHNIHGVGCRHIVAIGYGPDGTTGNAWDRVLGQGGIASGVTGERCVGAPIDAHPGHVGFTYQNVDAAVLDSASESGAVLQATNIDVDGLRIRGGGGDLVKIQHSGVPADEPPNVINLSRLDGSMSNCTKCVVVQPLDIGNQTNIQVNVFGASGHYTQYALHLTAISNSVSTEGGNMTMNVWGSNLSSDLTVAFVDCWTFRCKGEINLYGTDLHCKNTGTSEACVYAQTANGLLNYDPSIALTLSATSGATVTATAASAIFQDEHMFDLIQEDTSGTGMGQIIEVQSPTVAIIDTTVTGGATFSGTSISAGNWEIEAANKGTLSNGGAGGRINWYSGNGVRDYVSGSAQIRAENGDVVLGSEVRVRGEATFKSTSGIGNVYRAAAPSVATS